MVLTFSMSASTRQSWQADKDYVLTAMSVAGNASTNATLLTTDPAATAAALIPPSATKIENSHLAMVNGAGAQLSSPLKVPIEKGRTYFVQSAGASAVFLYLDEMPAT